MRDDQLHDDRVSGNGKSPRPVVIDWAGELAAREVLLRRIILARTGAASAVDDVFQQVALAAVAQRAPLADPSKAAAWLHRLAVVHAARWCRQQSRSRRALAEWARRKELATGELPSLDEWLLSRERHAAARAAIARLRPADAEIIMLKYADGFDYRQIAACLGITEKAVDRRLARARENLRRQLIRWGIYETEP
jgi:RNA polymerase sigma-70 factor (ECF subfamily)